MTYAPFSDAHVLQRVAECASRLSARSYGIVLISQIGSRAGQLEGFDSETANGEKVGETLLQKVRLNSLRSEKIVVWVENTHQVCLCFFEQIYDRRIGFTWLSFDAAIDRSLIEKKIQDLGYEVEGVIRNRKRLAIYNAISKISSQVGLSDDPIYELAIFIQNTLFPDYVVIWERERDYQSRRNGYKAIYNSDSTPVYIIENKGIVGYCFEEPGAFTKEQALRVDDFDDEVAIARRFRREIANIELLRSRGLKSGVFVPLIFDGKVEAVISIFFKRQFGATNIEQEILSVLVELFKGVLRHRHDKRFVERIKTTYRRVIPRINRTILVAEGIHQLKDDIAALRNIFSVLSAKTEKEEELLQRGRAVSRHLADLTSSLKDSWSQEDSSRSIRLGARKFSFSLLVDSLFKKYAEEFRKNSIVPKSKIPQELVLEAPYAMIERIIENAVTNSIKAFRLTSRKPRTLSISSHLLSDMFEIRVADNGPGVEPGVVGYIFEPFFTTNDQDSSGLGLFLASSAAIDLGGSARAESEWGRGFELIVELPRRTIYTDAS